MPFKTGADLHLRLRRIRKEHGSGARAGRLKGFESARAEARKRGKLRGIGISNTIERAAAPAAPKAPRCASTAAAATLFSGAVTAGQGHETVFKQLVCDRLGLDPDDIHYVQGDTDQVFFGEGTGGSRSATMAARRSMAADKVIAKAKAIAAHALKVDRPT